MYVYIWIHDLQMSGLETGIKFVEKEPIGRCLKKIKNFFVKKKSKVRKLSLHLCFKYFDDKIIIRSYMMSLSNWKYIYIPIYTISVLITTRLIISR